MRGGWRGLRRPKTHRPAPELDLFGFGVAKYVRDTSSSLKIPLSKIKDSGCQRFAGAITRQIVRVTYSSVIAASCFTGQLPGRDRGQQPAMTIRVIVRVIGPGEILLQLSSPGRKLPGEIR